MDDSVQLLMISGVKLGAMAKVQHDIAVIATDERNVVMLRGRTCAVGMFADFDLFSQ